MTLRVFWQSEKSFDVEPVFSGECYSIKLKHVSDTVFAGYDIGSARTTEIRFGLDEKGSVKELIIPREAVDIQIKKQKE